jgi:RNA polymerase sigma-70 factor (ECF subfamily)
MSRDGVVTGSPLSAPVGCHTARRVRRLPDRCVFTDRCVSGDDALVAAARRGNQDAYAELVLRYAGIAHRTATLIAGVCDAEDVVQDAFVRAYYALPRFRDGAPFRPWLLAIVANTARNAVRSRGRQATVRDRVLRVATPAGGAAAESAEAVAVTAAADRELLDAVAALPEKFRLVVTCRYLLELSEDETAQTLGWPRGTVKSRLSRALDRLRSDLADDRGAER